MLVMPCVILIVTPPQSFFTAFSSFISDSISQIIKFTEIIGKGEIIVAPLEIPVSKSPKMVRDFVNN